MRIFFTTYAKWRKSIYKKWKANLWSTLSIRNTPLRLYRRRVQTDIQLCLKAIQNLCTCSGVIVALRSVCSDPRFDFKNGFYIPENPYFDVSYVIKNSCMTFVKKERPFLHKHFLQGVFRQLLGSEVVNIDSWTINWECTITIKEKSRSFSSISLFEVGQKRGRLTGGRNRPPPPWPNLLLYCFLTPLKIFSRNGYDECLFLGEDYLVYCNHFWKYEEFPKCILP